MDRSKLPSVEFFAPYYIAKLEYMERLRAKLIKESDFEKQWHFLNAAKILPRSKWSQKYIGVDEMGDDKIEGDKGEDFIDESPSEVMQDHLEYVEEKTESAKNERERLLHRCDILGRDIEAGLKEIDRVKRVLDAVIEAEKPKKYL